MLQMLLDLFDDARRVRAPQAGAAEDSKPETPLAQVVRAPGAPQIVASAPPVALTDAVAPAQFAHPRANQSIRFAHAQVAYEFRRGQRRTIGFQVGADGLTVSAPRWTPMAEVEAVLRAKERWIVTKLSEARERHARLESARIEWREGAQLPFLGEPVVLVLDPRQRHGRGGAVLVPSESAGEGASAAPSPMALHIGLPQAATAQQLRDTVQAWLMRQARRLFTERLDHFTPQLGVQWKKLSLSSADTRWCSVLAERHSRI